MEAGSDAAVSRAVPLPTGHPPLRARVRVAPCRETRSEVSRSHVFHGITLAALVRMHDEGGGDHVIELDPDRLSGTVRRSTPLGDVAVRFVHDRAREEMTITIVKKPRLLPEAVLWAEVALVLRRAISQAAPPC